MRKRFRLFASVSTSFRWACVVRAAAGAAFSITLVAGSSAWAQDAFTLTSPSFYDGGTVSEAHVFNGGDCKGGNQSPQVAWAHPPAGTKSFAVTLFDIDAPGPGWWHWVVVNIPATVHDLPANASASGYLKTIGAVEARNDFDTDGYGGPCPPPGKPHRYVLTVYALDTASLPLSPGRPVQMFDHEISRSTLGSAKVTVTYRR
jgi:Raf kinase inhibitor-like YbhB/YbcL family protein